MAAETPVPLDEMDLRILAVLRDAGRSSHRSMAASLGIGLATVNRRVRRMEQSGVIRGYMADIDPHAVGWEMTVIVGLRIDKGHLRDVQQAIAKDARVFAVYDVTGEWDGVVLARVRSRADLDDLAKTTLSQRHVQRTTSMVVLSTVAEETTARIAG